MRGGEWVECVLAGEVIFDKEQGASRVVVADVSNLAWVEVAGAGAVLAVLWLLAD